MLTLLFLLVAVGAVSYFTFHLASKPGYVLIQWGEWQIESTVMLAFLATILLILVLYFLIGILLGIARLPNRMVKRLEKRRKKTIEHTSAMGFLNLIQGNWKKAEKQLGRTAKHLPQPVVHHLAAAYSAQQDGNSEKRDSHMKMAENVGKEFKHGIDLAKCRLLTDEGKTDEALAILKKLNTTLPNNAVVHKLLSDLYQKNEDWPEIHKLIPSLRKSGAVPTNEIEALANQAVQFKLNTAENSSELLQAWKETQKQRNVENLQLYVRKLLEFECHKEAESEIQQELDRRWNSELAYLYAKVGGAVDKRKLYQTASSWLKRHPEDTDLLLTAAKLAYRNNYTAEARDNLEKCVSLGGRSEAYAELGKILESQGDRNHALEAYKAGMESLEQKRSPVEAVPVATAEDSTEKSR